MFQEQMSSSSKTPQAHMLNTQKVLREPKIWYLTDPELQRIFRNGVRSDGLYLL